MEVLKFGGTSVGSEQAIKKLFQIVQNNKSQKVVVVSAMSGVTDSLINSIDLAINQDKSYLTILEACRKKHFDVVDQLEVNSPELIGFLNENFDKLFTLFNGCFLLGEVSSKAKDTILSYGELFSSKIIYQYFLKNASDIGYADSRNLIKTNENYGNAKVNFELTTTLINEFFNANKFNCFIAPGFISSDLKNNTTTLGRGGSDYTASIYASALNSSKLEIWTDVSGLYTANPKIVSQANAIDKISYKEAMELSHFGAKVIYAPTILPVYKKDIPLYIKNTFEPDNKGTLITSFADEQKNIVKGISHIEKISLLTLEGSGLIGVSGAAKRLFNTLSKDGINIVFITQASSEYSICIGVSENEALKAKKSIDEEFDVEISSGAVYSTAIENDLAIIAIVGNNMKNHQGVSGRMFSSLGSNNINIRAIAQGASEINISAVISSKDAHKALNVLHEQFFEERTKQLNLFVLGVGNVGSKLLGQVFSQYNYLKENLRINVRVIGVANSKKMAFDTNGFAGQNWKDSLANGETSNIDLFLQRISDLNLRNCILVDNTSNEDVAYSYQRFLSKSISVVTCNKIACASEIDNYKNLKYVSRKFNTPFLYETNVGAGLPIIDTLKNIIASGDQVNKIQAILSGSLNFIFNNFTKETKFVDVVKQAMVEGYTEPDPRIDLSGVDVMRKILILIRESGYDFDLSDIENVSFLPVNAQNTTSVDDFLNVITNEQSFFEQKLEEAASQNAKLKYVASFENGKAKVGLQIIPSDHPFYNVEGKDNIVLFYTDRYVDQPLLIKGAGAGAEVTASGIFADIIRIGNK